MKPGTLKTIALTLVAVVGVATLVGIVVVKTGAYNVAATKPHQAMTESVLSTMMENSVRHHASDIELSPAVHDPDLGEGFEHYQMMCVACHGAPGMEKSEIGEGLNPPPPDLAASVSDLSPQEIFWILKYGIKMTGMPAFGPTHDDEKLWDLTAFVKRLPTMTPDQYRAMAEDAEENEPGHNH